MLERGRLVRELKGGHPHAGKLSAPLYRFGNGRVSPELVD